MLKLLNKEKTILIILFASLLYVTLNSSFYFYEKFIEGNRYIFYDLPLNFCAGKLFSQNVSPYGFGMGNAPIRDCVNTVISGDWGMPVYIYSPIFLEFLKPLSSLEFYTLKNFWYFLSFFSVLAICIFSSRIMPLGKIKKIFPIFLLFSFGSIFFSSLISGNISIFGYSLIAISLFFLHQNKKNLFCFIIIFLTLIKPHFFIFLLIGFTVYGRMFFKHIFYSLVTVSIIYFVYFIFNTPIFLDFFNSLKSVNSKEWFFSFNSTFGLLGILNNLPKMFNNLFGIYFLSGPNILNNFIWIFLSTFMLIGLIIFRLSIKDNNLTSQDKSILIAVGAVFVILINPNVTIYDFCLFIPSIFYLVNVMNLKNNYINQNKLRYLIMILFVLIQDINFPFFTASLLFYLVLSSSINGFNILNLSKK